MPQFLRRDAVRLLEASAESLTLALTGLSVPPRLRLRESAAMYAPHTGLTGAAVEQAMAGCLIHVYGPEILLAAENRYKTGREILQDFRALTRERPVRASVLVSGIPNAAEHWQSLSEKTAGFTHLITARAAGLHAGSGPLRDVAVTLAKNVADFLETLAQSARVKPYLEYLPRIPEQPKQFRVLVDELMQLVRGAGSPHDRAVALSSLFLLLPETPDEPPEWLDALERVTVVPREADLTLLLNAINAAVPAELQRVGRRGEGLPVVVRPEDPAAIPIAPQYLRRSFTEIKDQFYADVGNANARLNQGRLNLPPFDFVLDLFAAGLDHLNLAIEGQLTAHETWAFIMASLSRQGTAGPYWFMVESSSDPGQLEAQLRRAFELATPSVRNRSREIVDGLQALRRNRALARGSAVVAEMQELLHTAEGNRRSLLAKIDGSPGTDKALSADDTALLRLVANAREPVGRALQCFVPETYSVLCRRYWARLLAESAAEQTDVPALVHILRQPALSQAHTAARKALRLIDFTFYGPSTE